jgi:putative membrane protein
MTTWQLLISTWHWHPSVLLGCAALIMGYLAALRFRLGKPALFFAASVLVLLVALLSPIHTLGDDYLFSAHMLQHLLLMQVVPPLLLLGIPPWLVRQALTWAAVGWIERMLGQPLVAWSIGIGTMWVWHLPALYGAALDHEGVHILEHLCFLVTATILWWPVVAPLEEARLTPLAALLYLFAAMVASSILGIILTFAPPGLYPAYLHPTDTLGILPLLRDGWGLSPAADQQLGGLLMWVPGNLAYLCAFIGTLARWYSAPEEDVESLSSVEVAREPPLLPHQRRKSNVA